jgi:hypothetical protein
MSPYRQIADVLYPQPATLKRKKKRKGKWLLPLLIYSGNHYDFLMYSGNRIEPTDAPTLLISNQSSQLIPFGLRRETPKLNGKKNDIGNETKMEVHLLRSSVKWYTASFAEGPGIFPWRLCRTIGIFSQISRSGFTCCWKEGRKSRVVTKPLVRSPAQH